MEELHFYDKKERPWPNNRLKQGSIVGHVTPTTVRLWLRTSSQGDFVLLLSAEPLSKLGGAPTVADDGNGPELQSAQPFSRAAPALHSVHPFAPRFDTDNTTVVEISGLNPDRCYYYAVIQIKKLPDDVGATIAVDHAAWEHGHQGDCSFKTLPGQAERFCFGLYSCHMPYPKDSARSAFEARLWNLLFEELNFADARFVIAGGDQVYADGNDAVSIWQYLEKVRDQGPKLDDMVSWYRDIYRGYWGIQGVRAVQANFPHYMIWDDHEIMDGWGSYSDDELSNHLDTLFRREDKAENLKLARRMKAAATQVYDEYQHCHNPPTEAGQYDYYFDACGSDYFVLDMRGYRDFDGPDGLQILGRAQHARLDAWITSMSKSANKGPLFVVSTVPMVHLKDYVGNLADWLPILGARDDVRDHWEHDSHAGEYRSVLGKLFALSGAAGRPLLVLSGDVHVGAIFDLHHDQHPKARLFQVTSSAITYALLGNISRQILVKAIKTTGRLKNMNSVSYRCLHNYAGNNFAIITVDMADGTTSNVHVDITGLNSDGGFAESRRVSLL